MNAPFTATFDFDTIIDRANTQSAKWELYGPGVLPMWVADMDFKSPQVIIDAITERAAHGVFGYQFGMPRLTEVLVERLGRLYDWAIQPDDLVYLPGLVPALFMTARTLGDASGGILMQTPVYPPFIYSAKANARPLQTADLTRTVAADGTLRYEIDFDAFEAAITPETSVFYLCNPHNPVGRAFTRAELERLAEICLRHNLLIVSDEIHCDLLLDEGVRHTPIASLSPEVAGITVTLMAPSKTFNIAGLGASFAVVQDAALRAKIAAQAHGPLPGVNVLGFTAALAAYEGGDPWLAALLAYLRANRDLVVDFAAEHLPGVAITRPEATYLAWLDCRALDLPNGSGHKYFLERGKVALNEGADFGACGAGHARLNFGAPRALLLDGLERLRAALGAE